MSGRAGADCGSPPPTSWISILIRQSGVHLALQSPSRQRQLFVSGANYGCSIKAGSAYRSVISPSGASGMGGDIQ